MVLINQTTSSLPNDFIINMTALYYYEMFFISVRIITAYMPANLSTS